MLTLLARSLPLLAGGFISGAILSLGAYRSLAGWDWFGSRFLRLAAESREKVPAGKYQCNYFGASSTVEQAAHNCLVHGSNPCAPG